MKIADIKQMATTDLIERLAAEEIKYNQMVMNHAVTPLENPAEIKVLRRTIARMKTEVRSREINK
ncbi:MAG: 50S ribosomal protein L29 [Bacteroidaceae bacterium]